ncbi:ImmA/IrrE family metallo-endopeptidase [Caballeronia novacaledonica]|uniref:ImmA/IrrE family metallo-endopeptidase n=2 Tax=Caballeronia novacaledonica TaxID=1544861 RepID=A0AA37I9M6_9BURK|nr:XRE family transcriptional regulator [Caballeronia novacaledonica]GJH18121.1 ImmA/IrrE family metallo-endopeptidase [Caballeronia novacaledonica]GJH25870.1 ImmA/IrrE family metallo-endopeptidase [Caballeronia novacaledonica]
MFFNPSRLEFARTRRGWTKARLAKELCLQVRSVQGYESGEYAPEPEKLAAICNLLRFPLEFFSGDDLPSIEPDTASFRSMSKMSATLRNVALGAGVTAFVLNDWIEERFRLPIANVPDLSDLSPEDAATTLRRMWGLGEAPISNLVHLLESKGIRVYSLAIDAREVDAFSVWHRERPFVFLNTIKSAEHSRFDAAHELGHLVRDRHSMLHGEAHSPNMEREANAFASAFLMPKASVLARRVGLLTMEKLIQLKQNWGVSLAALAFRMNQLGLFSEWAYRNLCIQIAKNGYRTSEPNPMRPEISQILRKVFDALRADGVTRSALAHELHIPKEDIDNLTFGLALSSVSPIGVQSRQVHRAA